MAAVTKKIIPFTAEIVVVETPVAYKTVLSRLDAVINKLGSLDVLGKIASVSSQTELQDLINSVVKGNDFLFFDEFPFGPLLSLLSSESPNVTLYVIGNPLIAQQIIKRNFAAGVNIPPRLLLIEKPNKSGTQLIYHLPSSTMLVRTDGRASSDTGLETEVTGLDQKLEDLVAYITRPAEDGAKL